MVWENYKKLKMSQRTIEQHLVSLKKQDWYSVQNSLVEASFTHLSPEKINVLSYKFFLCAICGWQQLPHVKSFVTELWASHTPTSNDQIPDIVPEYFNEKSKRTVTLWFEELSEFCTVSRSKDKKRKTYNRKRFSEAIEQAAKFHISTVTPVTIEEWSKFKTKVHSIEGITQDSELRHLSPILDFDEYSNNPFAAGAFIGHPIESIVFNEEKPLVSITFDIKFLHLLFATANYTTLSLDHLSTFKSLAAIRIHDMLVSRFNKQNALKDFTDLYFTVPRWRAMLGVNDTIELMIDTPNTSDVDKRKGTNLLSLTWEEIGLLSQPSSFHKTTESMNYKSMDVVTAVAFDDSIGKLNAMYREYLSGASEYSNSKGVLIRKNAAKYTDYKALVRDVFRKAEDEINKRLKSDKRQSVEVLDVIGKKRKIARTTTSVKIKGKRR